MRRKTCRDTCASHHKEHEHLFPTVVKGRLAVENMINRTGSTVFTKVLEFDSGLSVQVSCSPQSEKSLYLYLLWVVREHYNLDVLML